MSDENPEQTYMQLQTAGAVYYAPSYKDIAALASKLSVAMNHIGPVKDDAQHGKGFSYTTWDEIAAQVRDALYSSGLSFTAHVEDYRYEPNRPANVRLVLTITDTTSGAMILTKWNGEGTDIAQATTSGVKTWLVKTFLLSATDESQPRPAAQAAQTGKPAAQATQPRATTTAKAIPAQPTTSPPATADKATGEIQPPAPAAKPTLTPPAFDAPVGKKLTWLWDTAKSYHWTAKDYNHWLFTSFKVKAPSAIPLESLDLVCAQLVHDLTTELQF